MQSRIRSPSIPFVTISIRNPISLPRGIKQTEINDCRKVSQRWALPIHLELCKRLPYIFPMELVSMDIFGEIPKTQLGDHSTVVLKDGHLQLAELYVRWMVNVPPVLSILLHWTTLVVERLSYPSSTAESQYLTVVVEVGRFLKHNHY